MFATLFASTAVLTAMTTTSMSVPPQYAQENLENPASIVVYSQPWTSPVASHISRVESCQNPVVTPSACYDDFIFPEDSGLAVGVRWWGTLRSREQVGKTYYIGVYSDAGCQPGDLVYKDCVRPRVQLISNDCQGESVCRFGALIAPFPIQAGQKYWIQISENDADSLRSGMDDFRWSAQKFIKGCDAVKSFGPNEFGPVIDPCNNQMMDMAFQIYLNVP